MTIYEPADWRPEPGDVVEATNQYGTFACRLSSDGLTLKLTNNAHVENPTHIRRLQVVDPASTVVLDPNDAGDVERLAAVLSKMDLGAPSWTRGQARVALDLLLPAVTPPEPNGLGAVVWCIFREERCRGIYDGSSWTITRPGSTDYGVPGFDIAVETVDHHGVGCSCGASDCPGGAVTRPYCLRCEVPIYRDEEGIWRREGTGSQVCPRNPAVDGHEPRPDCNGGGDES